MNNFKMNNETQLFWYFECKKNTWINLKELLHLAKFAIANIVQVIAQVIRKVERSKIE